MRLPISTLLLCVGLSACAHDSRPETASTKVPARKSTLPYADEPRLTPASGVATPRTNPVQPDAQQADPNDSGIDQGDSEADLAVTREIRKSIVADKSLSFTAKNVIIITRDRRVTLRGQVNTRQERASIEKAARRVFAVKQVENELTALAE